MLMLLLRANNRWPRTVGFILNLSSGVYTERAFRKLVELAAPILVPASALRLPRQPDPEVRSEAWVHTDSIGDR